MPILDEIVHAHLYLLYPRYPTSVYCWHLINPLIMTTECSSRGIEIVRPHEFIMTLFRRVSTSNIITRRYFLCIGALSFMRVDCVRPGRVDELMSLIAFEERNTKRTKE